MQDSWKESTQSFTYDFGGNMEVKFNTASSAISIILLIILLMASLLVPRLGAVEIRDGTKGEKAKAEVRQSRIVDQSPAAGMAEEISTEKGIAQQKEGRKSLYDEIIRFFKMVVLLVIIGGILGAIGYFLYSYHKRIRKIERVLRNSSEGPLRVRRGKEDVDRYVPPSSQAAEDDNSQQEIALIKQRMDRFEKQFDTLRSEFIGVSLELREAENRSRALSEIIPIFARLVNFFQEIGGKMSALQKGGISYSQEKDPERGKPPREDIEKKKDISEKDLVKWWDKSGNQLLAQCRKTIEEEFKDAALEVISTTGHDKEDWRLIGIKNIRQNFFYVLPRKYSIWSPLFQKWFELEETGYMDPRIGSVFIPLPKARKDNYEGWGLVDKKGKVSIKEV